MAKPFRIFFFFFISLVLLVTTSQSLFMFDLLPPLPIPSAHGYIGRFGLPDGLIPSNVKSYNPHAIDLALEIKLEHPCYAEIGGKLFYYDNVIRGYINFGTIFQLSGVRVKKLFSWVPVTRIDADWSQKLVKIYYPKDGFSLDMDDAFEELPIKQFTEIPVCKKDNMDWLWMFHVSDF